MFSTKTRSLLALVASAAFYALTGPFIRILDTAWSELGQVAARWMSAFVIIYIIHTVKKISPVNTKEKISLGILGCIVSLEVILFVYAVTRAPLGTSVALLYAGTILTGALLGHWWFKEKITKTLLTAYTVCIAGLVLLMLPGSGVGIIFATLSGICGGIGNAYRRHVRTIDSATVLQYQFGVGALMSLMIALTTQTPLLVHVEWFPIVFAIAYGGMMLVHNKLLLFGFSHTPVTTGGVILSLEIVFSAILGVLLFSEFPSFIEYGAYACILLASVLVSYAKR